MKKIIVLTPVLALVFGCAAVADDKPHGHMKEEKAHSHMKEEKAHGHMKDAKTMPMADSAAGMTEGQIKRISKGSKKLTVKHGEIKNLDMPPMTMVFGVSDEKMLEMVKKGDKIKFKAEDVNGQMVITEIAPQ